jgi:WD40 repeat protein
VFISCPGDLAAERGVVSQALDALNQDPEFAGRVKLVTYAYENIAPARSGMSAQDVVNSYMLRPEDADLFICLFWRHMGSIQRDLINPATNAPYQSGTEYEYLAAYAAAQQSQSLPLILLYRCQRPAPTSAPATAGEQVQLERVNAFFGRFKTGGDLRGLIGHFTDDADLATIIQRDVATLLRSNLLPLLGQRNAAHGEGPVIFGLPPLPTGLVPRPESLEQLRKALLGSHTQVGVVAATALHGQGGLGKTMLARMAWDDPTIRAAFPDGVLWATLGQTPDLTRIQREWVKALGGDITSVTSPEAGRSELSRLIGDRALLLVLDDVWQASAAEALLVAGPRCRILLTTRDIGQARGATPIELDLMTPTESRQTLRAALANRVLDEATLNAIAERVGRLPLALNVLGAVLARSALTWPELAAQLDAHFQRPTGRDTRLFDILHVSVQALPAGQQARYRELVIFPEDVPLNPLAVARLWGRTGRLNVVETKELLGDLRERSLIQANGALHDLQVDYLRALVPEVEVRALHSALCDAYAALPTSADATRDASPWFMLPTDDDRYAWRFLATHLSHANRQSDLEYLLTDMTYLETKLAQLGVAATVADLSLLSEVEPIRHIASVIRAGTATLSAHPDELLNEVHGRWGAIPALHHLPTRAVPYFDLVTRSLKRADDALISVFTGHTDSVNACAFSPDGRYALSASSDQTLRLWNIANGQELRRLSGHTGFVNACAFSPDGHYALSASSDQTLRLWDVANGQELRQFVGHTNMVADCAFSPDGRYALSASWDKTLRLWDVATGQEVRQFTSHTSFVNACAFSPDGRYALSASWDKTLRLWDVATGQEVRQFASKGDYVSACAFSPNGRYALSCDERSPHLWEVSSGQEVRAFTDSLGVMPEEVGCAFSPDGRYALTASRNGILRLWAVSTGREIRQYFGHTDGITACAFSPDGRSALTASHDHTLRLWKTSGLQEAQTSLRHSNTVTACAFSPDGRYALSCDEWSPLLWEVSSGREILRFTDFSGFSASSATGCAFSPDGHYALSATSAGMRLWKVSSGKEIRQFIGHSRVVSDCAFSPDGRYALSASGDQLLCLWEVRSGKPIRQFHGHTNAVTSCAFSPDGRYALSGSGDRTLRLWLVASGHEVRLFAGHIDDVTDCMFSPDGRYVLSASRDRTLRLWAVSTGQEVRQFTGHAGWVNACAFSPDGRSILSASIDQTLRLWDVATGAHQAIWHGEASNECCAFSPLGDRVMAGDSSGGVHLLKVVGLPITH